MGTQLMLVVHDFFTCRRRVSISEFRGTAYVGIREFYEKVRSRHEWLS
jgi:hypothetical protein